MARAPPPQAPPAHNTHAWFLTLSGGKVIDGTAFYDGIALNELWDRITP
jgi:hypothetical protein